MTMRDMSKAELAAWNGLIAGQLEPLADILAAEDAELHPILARWLVKLIRGSPSETDYRLRADKHPDLARASDGLQAQRLNGMHSLQTALKVLRHGGLRGQWEAAVQATIDETGLKRRTVAAHWSEHKQFILFSLASGVIRDTDQS
jgi:hypothetical protein